MARIVHLANMYSPVSGGLRTAVQALGETYLALGHDFVIIVPGKKLARTRTAYGIKYEFPSYPIPFSGGYRVITHTKKIKQLLLKLQPEIVEISDRTTLLLLASWAKRNSLSTALFAHERIDGVLNAFLGKAFPAKWFADIWNRKSSVWLDHVIATTEFAAEEYERIGIRVRKVPLGVDLQRFNPEFQDVLLKQDLAGGKNLAFAMTRLSKEKDPGFLLDICRLVKAQNLDFHIVVAGAGPLLNSLRNTAALETLPISFLGHIGDRNYLSRLLATADVYLAPGPIETFGLAALESLASGVPVVCRDTGAIQEIINLESGVALPRNAQKWVTAMTFLTSMEKSHKSSPARLRAEQFSWHQTACNLLNLYQIEAIREQAA
jgi:alpha-1,6-mannosyltransferase